MEIIEKIENEKPCSPFLCLLIGFLAGIVVGFIISPVKKGIAIGSYNGCGNKISDSNKFENGKSKASKNK